MSRAGPRSRLLGVSACLHTRVAGVVWSPPGQNADDSHPARLHSRKQERRVPLQEAWLSQGCLLPIQEADCGQLQSVSVLSLAMMRGCRGLLSRVDDLASCFHAASLPPDQCCQEPEEELEEQERLEPDRLDRE